MVVTLTPSCALSEGRFPVILYCAHRTIDMLPPSLLVISLGMGADGSSTAHSFFTRPPTGRSFSPALPSDCFAIDFPGRASYPGEGLPLFPSF